MKRCYTCKETLPVGAFGKRSDSRDGRAHWCLECARAYHAEYRRKNPERIRQIKKMSRERNKEQYLAYQKKAYRMRQQALASPDGIL